MNDLVNISGTPFMLLLLGALFVHVCYQLSVSVLTHMSSHSLSRKVTTKRLLGLGLSYSLGAYIATTLVLLAVVTFATLGLDSTNTQNLRPAILLATTLLPLVGLVTVLFYFRRGPGTKLWLPRSVAKYLLDRSKKTTSSFEAAMLGAGTVVGELPFLVAPLLLVATLIAAQPLGSWLLLTKGYALLAVLPLVVTTLYLTSGHSPARLQRWRENNKKFLQWTSGLTLIALTFYLTIVQMGAI